jgi:hypothetical protein
MSFEFVNASESRYQGTIYTGYRVINNVKQLLKLNYLDSVYFQFKQLLSLYPRLILGNYFVFHGFTWCPDVVEFLRKRGYDRPRPIAALIRQTGDRVLGLYMVIAFTMGRVPLPKDLGKKLMEFLVVL